MSDLKEKYGYSFMDADDTYVPEHTRGCIKRYIENRIPCGSFMNAVLENDLNEALIRADSTNLANLKTIVSWIFWYAPRDCWGSKEKVTKWLKRD